MRSIWNGTISFGLVSIPVKLMNATENHSISFRQIHLADGGRIRYRKVCELDEQEVTGAETGKAYEDADGTIIPITDEDLASLPLPTAKTIEIEGFVPASAVDTLQLDSAYYLAVNGVPAAKPYALLREALRRSEKVAVAKYALRGRERLGMLRVIDDVIALHGLLWPDEIRAPEGVAPDSNVKVRDAELDLADALMNTLGEADLDTLHDDYREAVEELVAAKAAGEPVEPEGEEEPDEGKVIDLMAALENSVRAAKESHGGQEDDGEVAEVHPISSGKGKASAKRGGGTRKKAAEAARGTDGKKTAQGKETAAGKKAAAEESAGGKPAARKTASQKTASEKKASQKTASEKKAPEEKSSEKSAPKKSASRKSPAKKAPARKPAAGRKTASDGRGDTSGTSSRQPRKRTSA